MRKSHAGKKNPAWRGGRYINTAGYVLVYAPKHPRISGGRYVQEHTLVAEKAIRKYLPKGAVIHHVNDNRQDNRGKNLVLCESVSYHRLLHTRRNAYRATGNVNARRCGYCHQWVIPGETGVIPMGTAFIHRSCRVAYGKARYDPVKRHQTYLATGQ